MIGVVCLESEMDGPLTPTPTLNLTILASNHLNHPTPHVPCTTFTGLNHLPPLLTATHSIFGFWCENPLPHPILCSPPCICPQQPCSPCSPQHLHKFGPPPPLLSASHSIFSFGVKTPPARDLKFLTSCHLNCWINATQYIPSTPSILYFIATANNESVRAISVTWGQKHPLCAISSSPSSTTSTVGSTPPHTHPPHPPYFIFLPWPITRACDPYPSLGVKNPTSAQSQVPTLHMLFTIPYTYSTHSHMPLAMYKDAKYHFVNILWIYQIRQNTRHEALITQLS